MKTPRGIRNNNPGNLDKGSPWQGLVANPDEPRFCTFKDPVWGIRALAVTLITYHDKRRAKDGSSIDTIREVIERWAPPNENNTDAYINEVSKAVGVTADMIIDLHDYDILRPLVEAIIRHENGRGPLKTLNTWYAACFPFARSRIFTTYFCVTGMNSPNRVGGGVLFTSVQNLCIRFFKLLETVSSCTTVSSNLSLSVPFNIRCTIFLA